MHTPQVLNIKILQGKLFFRTNTVLVIVCLFAGENVLVPPPNLQCACLDDRLRFTCTVVDENRIGATWWSGTAFTSCDGGRIQLRHSNANAVGECDGGTIRATSLGFEGNCSTSALNIVVDSGLNNKTVQCVFASNSGMPTIGAATISLTTGILLE